MRNVLREIANVSKYDCNVIIFGDTGVGKEKVANLIQKNSDRRMQPFVKINCGAISPNLIESEFFGYEKGAFTGANASGKKGYFEIANNGVMFLDEIGELPLEMQAKLLRVIQDGEFYKVGRDKPDQDQCQDYFRDQPRPRKVRGGRKIPPRPLLPAQCRADSHSEPVRSG